MQNLVDLGNGKLTDINCLKTKQVTFWWWVYLAFMVAPCLYWLSNLVRLFIGRPPSDFEAMFGFVWAIGTLFVIKLNNGPWKGFEPKTLAQIKWEEDEAEEKVARKKYREIFGKDPV